MKPTPTPDLNIGAMRAATIAYNESLDGKHFGATERIIRAYLSALSVPAAAVVGEPEIPNTPILFGLEAQGHIPVIEKMLAGGESWQAIGTEIGWDGETARSYYERYKARQTLAAPSAPDGLDRVATLEHLLGEIMHCHNDGTGLLDCMDNKGGRYTSKHLSETIEAIRAALGGASHE